MFFHTKEKKVRIISKLQLDTVIISDIDTNNIDVKNI